MKKKANKLEFISRIKPDGSGVSEVSEEYIEFAQTTGTVFTLNRLSIKQGTYIASGVLSFIVRIKPERNCQLAES
jgi:hypothetical protein